MIVWFILLMLYILDRDYSCAEIGGDDISDEEEVLQCYLHIYDFIFIRISE